MVCFFSMLLLLVYILIFFSKLFCRKISNLQTLTLNPFKAIIREQIRQGPHNYKINGKTQKTWKPQ